jgi:hypothetical protein
MIKFQFPVFELQHILANVRLAFRSLTHTEHAETDDFEACHAETDLFSIPSHICCNWSPNYSVLVTHLCWYNLSALEFDDLNEFSARY